MKVEKILFASAPFSRFIVDWETISNSIKRRYTRTFSTFKDLNSFIRQNPNRGYYLIREEIRWFENRENFMSPDGVSKVYCSKTVKIFEMTDFDLLPF